MEMNGNVSLQASHHYLFDEKLMYIRFVNLNFHVRQMNEIEKRSEYERVLDARGKNMQPSKHQAK